MGEQEFALYNDTEVGLVGSMFDQFRLDCDRKERTCGNLLDEDVDTDEDIKQ